MDRNSVKGEGTMEMLAPVLYAVLAVIIVAFLYYYGTRNARKLEANFPGLPGPKPLPFVDNLFDLVKVNGQTHILLEHYSHKYGKLYSMIFAGSTSIVVSDPEMLKDIFVKRFDCFHDRPKTTFFPKPLDSALPRARGEDWKRIRTTLSSSFSAHKLKAMMPLMNLVCDALIKKIEKLALTKESFDIVSYQQTVAMDVIMSTAFGIQTDFQNNPNDPIMQTATQCMSPNLFMRFLEKNVIPALPYGIEFLKSQLGKRLFFKKLFKVADIAQKVVEARKKGAVRKDFLDLMLNASLDNKKLSDDEVVAQSVFFLLAGYDSTSTTLAMICYHLATNPEVQEKVQQEIDQVWPGEEEVPSYDIINDLPYLDMVISETLRICPQGFVLIRECTKQCTIKGLKIPKDTLILVPAYTINRDPAVYPDPEKFDPERFNEKAKQSRDPYAYVGFGQGPRSCIGMRFAQMEMKLVLARVLRSYSFITTSETKTPVLVAKLTLCPTEGIILGVKKRDNAV